MQDVGLSKILINESTLMTSFQGTFEWAPPELINGGECSEKADIYSFGVILWEIVTAERPFRKQFRPPQCAPNSSHTLFMYRCLKPEGTADLSDVPFRSNARWIANQVSRQWPYEMHFSKRHFWRPHSRE